MALTINNFWGAESGGTEELTSVTGSVAASTTQVHSGTYSYYVPVSANFDVSPFESVADAGNDYIVGFWFYHSSTARVSCNDSVGGTCIEVRQSPTTLSVIDANGSTIDSTSNAPSTNAWHFMELYWQRSATGSYEIFIDGVSITSGSGEDFDNATSTFDEITFNYIGSALYYDDMYIMSGCSSSADRLGGCEVYSYRSNKESWTPDDGGDNLNVGAPTPSTTVGWNNTQVVPFNDNNWAGYDSALAGAVNTDDVGGSAGTGGPNTDGNITGSILAIKGIWRMDRGNGGGTAHYGLLGNSVDGTIRSADFDPPTSPANYFMVSEWATVVPTSSEYCQIGIECFGPQDFQCYDMLATILHVPAVAAYGFPFQSPLAPFTHLLTR